MKTLVPSLLPVPRAAAPGPEPGLPHARRIFPLRNLHFRDVRAVGFDMDYTLSHYQSPEIDDLAFRHALALLVSERGYPADLLALRFDPGFPIRGLVMDGAQGNLLKLDRERQVVRATHGTRPLTREAIDAVYERRRLVSSGSRFRSIDTLFEIPECHLYALLVDAADAGALGGRDHLAAFHDVRWAIDTAHRNGVMKAEILARPQDFILRDPELPAALDRWKRAGKKLFVLSNSEWTFTEGVLSHLLDGQDPARPLWTDYFDLVVTSARKPLFFTDQPEPVALAGHDRAFTGGHAAWLEETLGAFGEQILYVGDHIYGDILRSKKNVSWHTLLLIPELGATLARLEEQASELHDFVTLESARRSTEARASLIADLIQRNREHRHLLAPRLSPEALAALDREAGHMQTELAAIRMTGSDQQERIARLDERLKATFNPFWGSIFREGYDQTRFADQIQTYACAYTGRISNLYHVDPTTALYAPVPTLPHERI